MKLRASNLEKLGDGVYDALIIGGGVNGAVSAAALSGKGAKVALIDLRDFAGFTSQQTSNLAWGGIKYLESHDYDLVWGLCKSRNHLMENFPSSVREIRFYSTIEKGFRHHPRFVWLGTWLYWLFGNTFTAIPRWLPKKVVEREEPRINTRGYSGAFEYSDAYLHDNDARFVFQFIRSAMDRGCIAGNYVESAGATRVGSPAAPRTMERKTELRVSPLRSSAPAAAQGAAPSRRPSAHPGPVRHGRDAEVPRAARHREASECDADGLPHRHARLNRNCAKLAATQRLRSHRASPANFGRPAQLC